MYNYKINFMPRQSLGAKERYVDLIDQYLSSFIHYGLVLDLPYEIIKLNERLHIDVICPEQQSLSKRYYTSEIEAFENQVKELFDIHFEYTGTSVYGEDSCDCQAHSWFFFMGLRTFKYSPIICGSCFKSIPLYKIPVKKNIDISTLNINHTNRIYKSIDELWYWGLSESYYYKQMNNPGSLLSRECIQVCKDLEEATQMPVYYLIFQFEHFRKECPVCKENWELPVKLNLLSYKCDKCRLVSI